MNDVDYLIVGQGLAGTLLANTLLKHRHKIIVIDHPKPISASRIASGIMNPITGRRFVKSWMFEELMATALKVYLQLERDLSRSLLYRRNIIRTVHDTGSLNDWMARTAQREYAAYVVRDTDQASFSHPAFHPLERTIESAGSYQLDIPTLVNAYSQLLKRKKRYYATRFVHDKLQLGRSSITYEKIRARGIIFCEGHALARNPLFKRDLLHPSVGERLIIKSPDLIIGRLVKKKYFLAPLSDGNLWYGADTHWNFDQTLPSNLSREKLLTALDATIHIPYHLVGHAAAIRPTVHDRRPILGQHPMLTGVYVFNGLGTKGASLAPFWSEVLVGHLMQNKPIPREVSIQRFFKE